MKLFLLTALSCLMALPVYAEVKKDIPYGEKARNQLDLYLPDGVDEPPMVVFIHGGRWFRNDKTQIENLDRVNQILDSGMAIASINYTFSSEAIWPAQLEDLHAAFDFLRENGATYGYDADRMAVWGQSSGAHLALWAAFDQAQSPETALDGLVSWYAPSDLYEIIPDRAADDVPDRDGMNKEPSPESLLIGATVPENEELADVASPLNFLATLPAETILPDTLLVHGSNDFVISPLQTERLYDAMQAHGSSGKVEMRIVDGGGHGRPGFEPEVPAAIAFLKQVFD
ncbi:alpha/beta hydrolase fold domain-containing protein [Phaeobacter sp. C3_T13_0]|uniref:alpha/beta hydrolase fold domain-containing protein n=1 Tax=Phaeobacter cretensis TaxID=3342641 RepID=UPI0039BD0F73